MKLSKVIGYNLKYLRYKSDLSQEKFYEQYNLNPKYLACIERGEINISVDFLQKLAKIFNVDLNFLITYNKNNIINNKRIDSKRK
jgi:transcriptional regulator with XRE-family HTH domain